MRLPCRVPWGWRMDARRFDDLSRLLASGVSRRRVLKTFAVTALGGLAVRSVGVAAAPSRELGEKCGTGRQCASGFCDTAQRPGQCACPPGTTACGGHAGSPIACVPACPAGQVLHPYVCRCCTPTDAGCIFA
jgi:hypothetical protein